MSFFSRILAFLVLLIISIQYSWADVDCGFHEDFPYTESTIPLNGTIYAGEDIPVGTTLYKFQATTSMITVAVKCQTREPWSVNTFRKIGSEPMGASFNFTGNTFNGAVYPTNIMGVGVAIYTAGGEPTITSATPYLTVRNCVEHCSPGAVGGSSYIFWHSSFYIAFVKTGTIAGGSTILGSSVPSVVVTAEKTPGLNGFPLTLRKVNFSGSIVVQSSTCQAKDKTVNLGEYDLRTTFRGKGSVTKWVDSSIELINCPAFIGYYSSAQNSTDGATPTHGTPTQNKLLVSLTANTGVIDATKGLISINKTQSGAASGIGIQLGWGDRSNPTTWDISNSKTVTPPADGTKNITIPMAARYYQTDDVVSPGRADGQVMFTIEYR
ncbi:TPA: fimbrial protein [Enterobacter hormaechei subsp. xiangfangensis]